jgi:hypothetical protein
MSAGSLKAAVETVLLQGRGLLNAVSQEQYARREERPDGASLGAHYRHVLDHFSCLLEGIDAGQVNYDQRRRDAKLENSMKAAQAETEELIVRFRNLPDDLVHRLCTVVYCVGYGESEAHAVGSNIAREVMFCVGHAIHHFAILKLLCAAIPVRLPFEFGVAPSTLKYLKAQPAA